MHGAIPLLFYFPLPIPLASLFYFPLTYLETLLAVIGSRPPWSRVTRKLAPPFSTPPHSKFPVPRLIVRLTTATSRSRLLLSGTFTMGDKKKLRQETNVFYKLPSNFLTNHPICKFKKPDTARCIGITTLLSNWTFDLCIHFEDSPKMPIFSEIKILG